MLQPNEVNLPEELRIEDISSPLGEHIFELCDPEPLQNSELSSTSPCSYEDNSPYTTRIATATATTIAATNNGGNHPVLFDSPEEIPNDDHLTASIYFSSSPPFHVPPPQFLSNSNQQNHFDLSLLQFQSKTPLTIASIMGAPSPPPSLPPIFDEECLSLIPHSYMRLESSSPSSCSFLDPPDPLMAAAPYLPDNLAAAIFAGSSGIFTGNLHVGNELQMQNQELEYRGDNGVIFCSESLPGIYNSSELQGLSSERSQHVVNGGVGSCNPLGSDISTLEDSTFKVGKLSLEERKEKIHRYMKKRNQRNFSKKIKYACRKTLADSRPRVRGRFAKNDECNFNIINNHKIATYGNHEDDTDEDPLQIVLKEEEDLVDSSDIFAHISGVNSFKSNYSLQSWI